MTQATSKDYWISPNALYIELNALGNPDYIQASCVSGAQILVYVNGIISYDAGHNYRRWSLQANPTVFNDHNVKYVYAAIPRDTSSTKSALIVFPSEQIDIYGKNASETQIGSEDYYYIFLQGIISTSGDNGATNRDWQQRISTGTLSSDEAIKAQTSESEWYKYSSVDQITTFLKDLTMKVGTKFHDFFAKSIQIVSGGKIAFENNISIFGNGESITGVANSDTEMNVWDKMVSPAFLESSALSKKHSDSTSYLITFLKGIALGTGYGIDEDGNADLNKVVLSLLQSIDYDYAGQAGFGFTQREDGRYKLSLTDLEVWGRAVFHELEIRKLSYVGGNYIFSPAGSKIVYVKNGNGSTIWQYYRCYFLSDDGTTATQNLWKVNDLALCETFDIAEGTTTSAGNKRYWRKVIAVSSENEQITDDDGNILFGGEKFGWVDLSMVSGQYEADSDEPAAGDTICCMGNTTDTSRQHAIEIMSVGDIAPAFIQYEGIKTFTLPSPVIQLSTKGGNKITGELYTTDGKNVRENIGTLEEEMSGVSDSVSEIKQTAEKLSLKVTRTAVRDRNLLGNSYVNIGSTLYGFCSREVKLEKGKTYTLSTKGMVIGSGGELKVYVYAEDTSGTWTWSKSISLTSATEATASVTFDDVPSDGTYHVRCFSYPQTSGKMVYVKYIQLEEGEEATPWSMNADDAAVNGNLLPDMSNFFWNTENVTEKDGVALPDGKNYLTYYAKNTGTSETDNIWLDEDFFHPESGESYTFSFWAKGTGTVCALLVDGCCLAVTSEGDFNDNVNGLAIFNLTSDWKRHWVTWSSSVTDSTPREIIALRVNAGAEVTVAGFKLEPYGRMTDYSQDEVTATDLLATGIDIEDKKITVTADKFVIQNNQGSKTFSVDENGLVTMNHIAVGGMINKCAVDVTKALFATLFDSWQDTVTLQWYGRPKISWLYGIYYFTQATGKSQTDMPLTLNMPSAYVNPEGKYYGDVYDDDGNMSETLLRGVRALVGNTVLIYNDSTEDIAITGMSPYFVDVWESSNSSNAKTTVLKAASTSSSQSKGDTATDATDGMDTPIVDGDISPTERYVGRKRNELTVTLKGGKHHFVSMTCVCEVGNKGWENIYWLVNYGAGLNS